MSEESAPGTSSSAATPAPAETAEADDDIELLEGGEGSGVSQPPPATVKEKKKTSPLWKHFEPSVDPSKAVCKHCNEKVKDFPLSNYVALTSSVCRRQAELSSYF